MYDLFPNSITVHLKKPSIVVGVGIALFQSKSITSHLQFPISFKSSIIHWLNFILSMYNSLAILGWEIGFGMRGGSAALVSMAIRFCYM